MDAATSFPRYLQPVLQPPIRLAGLFIPLQLPLSPRRVFAIGIEHALNVTVFQTKAPGAPVSHQGGSNGKQKDRPKAVSLRL
jgi:hypothetical protein